MKILITLLAITISMSSAAEASGKAKLFSALRNAAVKTMDEEKLVKNFNQGLMTSRASALNSVDNEGAEILLTGVLQDKSHFVLEVVSTSVESQIDRVALRLSTNTRNPALFSDMFLTLKSGPAIARGGFKGEKVAIMVVDTKNLTEVNQKLAEFLHKAQSNGFNTNMMSNPVLSRSNVLPFKGSK